MSELAETDRPRQHDCRLALMAVPQGTESRAGAELPAGRGVTDWRVTLRSGLPGPGATFLKEAFGLEGQASHCKYVPR